MKIIDLLNKIANGKEVPKKIKVNNRFYYEYDENIDYKSKDGTYLFDTYIQINKEDMNTEVEIIEEAKKIEKIGNDYYHKTQPEQNQIFQRKINELIDKVNSLENKK